MAEPEKDERWPRWKTALVWLGQWLVFFGAWILFVGNLEPAELLAGGVTAAIAATGSHIAWATHLARFSAHFRWVAQGWRLPWYVIADTGTILLVLLRHLFTRRKVDSVLIAVPFKACGPKADAAALRALAIAYTSITPNSVVVGIDQHRGLMLLHQLERSGISRMTRNLGAEP